VQRVNDLSVCMVFSPWPRQGATRSRGSKPRGVKTWRGHGPKSAFDISLTRHAVTARSAISSVLENGTGFDTRSGPGYNFECGMGNVSYSKSFSGAEHGLER
jgi:hypothetical protein